MNNKGVLLGLVFVFLLVMTSGLVSASVTQDDLLNNMVSYYKLDETSGTNVEDIHSTNDATLVNGASWGTGLINNGVVFDGVNDYISFPISFNGNQQNSYSVSYKFKLDSAFSSANSVNVALINAGGGVAGANPVGGQLEESTGKIRAYLYGSTGFPDVSTVKNSWLADTWYHIFVTYDSSTSTISIYVDGELDNYHTATGGVSSYAFTNWYAGYNVPYSQAPFDGVMDEIIIWDVSVNSSVVQTIFDIQKDGLESGQYNFSEAFIFDIEYSEWNITSNNVINSTVWNTNETAQINSNELSFTFNTSSVANCSAVLNNNWNYTYAISQNANYLLSENNSFHNITIIDDITLGEHELFVSCYDGDILTTHEALRINATSSLNANLVNISNNRPIWNADTLNGRFNVSDSYGSELNVSSSWWKKTTTETCSWQGQSCPEGMYCTFSMIYVCEGGDWERHTTNNQTFINVTQNTEIDTTNGVGRVPFTETNNWDEWKFEVTITDGIENLTVNSTNITIENTPPNITFAGSNTNLTNPKNIGEDVTFTFTGTDLQGDLVTMKVCSNPDPEWDTCTLLCENTVGVSFSTSIPTNISCDYTLSGYTTRQQDAYSIMFDGDYVRDNNISYYVNQFPTITDIQIRNTDGASTFYFGETIDYIKTLQNDTYDNNTLPVYITVKDPDGVLKVDNQLMTKTDYNGTDFDVYSTNIYLDAIGNWTVNLTTTDSDGALTTVNHIMQVLFREVSTLGRIYGYDFQTFPTYTNYSNTLTTYSYYLGEIRIDKDTTWSNVSEFIQTAKNDSNILTLTIYDDLSDPNATLTYLENFDVLINANHLLAMRNIKLYIADGVIENSTNSEQINNYTKKIFQEIQNKYPITIRNYNHTDINTDYAKIDTYDYITSTNISNYINQEMSVLKAKTDKSRIYYDLDTSFKVRAFNWQSLILDKMRSNINLTSSIDNPLVVELTNGDLIIANNQSEAQNITFTIPASSEGFDLYNLNTKQIIQKNISGNITVEVGQDTAYMVYKTELSKVEVLDDGRMFVYSNDPVSYPQTIDLSTGATSESAFQFVTSTSNPEDGRLILTDPSYTYADFYVYYGTAGSEAIGDWSNYDYVIIGDTNETWAEGIANITKTFGYVSVNDYGNNNCLASTEQCWSNDGCTDSFGRGSGALCDAWNRTEWQNTKEEDVTVWTNMSNMHIFIDGLDIGEVNDIDNLFGDALIELNSFVKITKNRETILNTYTSYADYTNIADYVMRESACSRWAGDVYNPIYSYEDIELDVTRANFHKAHGIPLMAQSFGEMTDKDRSYYCYMQNKVLYGDLALYSYNQPDFFNVNVQDKFQWNYFKYPELGIALDDEYEVEGDVYTRRFEKGIVSVNVTDRTVDFQNDIAVTNMTFCAYYYDNDDGVNDEGKMRFVVNRNLSNYFDVTDDDLTAYVKTWKCQDIPVSFYDETGFYELEFWYVDNDGNLIGNSGLFMYNGYIEGADKLSFWDNTLNDHPVNNKAEYNAYGLGTNWVSNFTINAESTGNAFDRVDTVITRTETGSEELTVNFNSVSSWQIPIEDKLMFMNKTLFNGIRVGETQLNYTESEDCIGSLPTYSNTTVDGETWRACYYNENPAEQGYYVKVVIPHLSEQEYTIDGNTPPEISNEVITLLDLTGHNQTWRFNFNHSDPDGNDIISCNVLSNNETFTTNPVGNSCEVEIIVPFNATQLDAYIFVEDEYNKSSTNGNTFNLSVINYDTISNSSIIGNLTEQHFIKYWNITQTNGEFNNIDWNFENLTTKTINISNGTTRNYLNYTTNVITYGDLDFIPDGAETYVVNSAESVYRFFNITGNLTTGETVPSFKIELPQPEYISGTQQMTKECGVFNEYTNFTAGTELIATIQPQTDSATECYYYLYNAKIIYSNSVLNYTDSGGIRTYFFSNEDANNYGRKINFMFDELKVNTTKINDIIPYTTLTNWNDRLSATQVVNRFVSPATFTQETNGVDYTYQDITASEIVRFDWTELNTPIDALYINLSWTYEAPVPEAPPSSGGGGGGGSSPAPATSSQVDLTKLLCDISVIPSRVVITDNNPVVELTIVNRESVSYTPDYEFKDVLGQPSIQKNVQLTNEIGTLLANQQKQFGVKYQGGIFGSTAMNGAGELILSSTRCRDIIVPIDMNITASNPLADLISGDEPLLQRTTKFLNDPITEQVSWSKMWLLIGMLSLLFGLVLWDKQWSNSELTNWIVKGIAWLFLTALATGIISLIIRGILGG